MGSTDPRMTDQPGTRSEVVRRAELLDCMPCHEKVCPLEHHKCMEDVTAVQVLAACDRVLAMPRRERTRPRITPREADRR
jgi:heptosyltransferase-2